MSSLSDDKLADQEVTVNALPSVKQTEADNAAEPPKASRKETLSAYFTIAAAAFGLIR